VENLRSGQCKAIAVVGMLIEGFDLPSLRIVAYHDKHKSLPTTTQLIGRLARVDRRFPQPSVLVTARDVDVFPELRGVVRELYQEDADWAVVLPGIIDDEIAETIADREYVKGFAAAPPELSIEAIHPLRRSLVLEIAGDPEVFTTFDTGTMPAALQAGQLLRGATIIYSDLNNSAGTAVVVTMKVARPRWHNDAGLDAPNYDLHLVSYRRSTQTNLPSLVFVNSGDGGVVRELLKHFRLESVSRAADPTRLQEAFDSLERLSVSSIGVRNNFLGRGTASYRMFAGSGVDRGLRESDTNLACLGHAMIQVPDSDGAFTAGVSTGKGKYWETRYAPLRGYDSFITDLADRYWFPPAAPSGQLLPQVSRGRRLLQWPASTPVAAEVDFALIGRGWIVEGYGPIEVLDLRAREPSSGGSAEQLALQLVAPDPQGERVIWEGHQDVVGQVVTHRTADLNVRHGFANSI
jgi:hypothetical protein